MLFFLLFSNFYDRISTKLVVNTKIITLRKEKIKNKNKRKWDKLTKHLNKQTINDDKLIESFKF